MSPAFRSSAITLRGTVRVAAGLDQAFPLFSPAGERRWVPGWDPELLHPAGTDWAEGQIFRTREETGEAVWIVTRLDRRRHEAQYHRVEPGRCVARVAVQCVAVDGGDTEASVEYTFVGLSEAGNREIEAMTPQAYEEKMARWAGWIARYLGVRS